MTDTTDRVEIVIDMPEELSQELANAIPEADRDDFVIEAKR